jgi:hypothetical protein
MTLLLGCAANGPTPTLLPPLRPVVSQIGLTWPADLSVPAYADDPRPRSVTFGEVRGDRGPVRLARSGEGFRA